MRLPLDRLQAVQPAVARDDLEEMEQQRRAMPERPVENPNLLMGDRRMPATAQPGWRSSTSAISESSSASTDSVRGVLRGPEQRLGIHGRHLLGSDIRRNLAANSHRVVESSAIVSSLPLTLTR